MRFKKFKTIITGITILLTFNPSLAEESGFEIEQQTERKQDILKYMFANAGVKYLAGSVASRYIYGATAGIDYPIKDGKLYLKTNISRSVINLELEKKQGAKDELPDTKSIKIKHNDEAIEEVFVEKSFNKASVSLGRSKIVLSEGGVGLTPFTFILPNKTLSNGFEGIVLDSLIAQDNLQIGYNITNNMEIRGYFIHGAAIDKVVKDNEKTIIRKNPSPNSTKKYDYEEYSFRSNDKVDMQKMFLLSYYPSWGKIKLLYSDGYNLNYFAPVANYDRTLSEINGEKYYTYQLSGESKLLKLKAYGISADWTYKSVDMGVEAIHIRTKSTVFLDPYQIEKDLQDKGGKPKSKALQYLIDKNGGSNLTPFVVNIAAFKSSYETGKWTFGGNIIAIQLKHDEIGKEAYKLSVKAAIDDGKQSADDAEFDPNQTDFAFAFLANYELSEQKSISGYAGLFLNVAGVGTNYTQEVNDNFSFGVSGFAGKFVKDGGLSMLYSDENYGMNQKIEGFLGLHLSYEL